MRSNYSANNNVSLSLYSERGPRKTSASGIVAVKQDGPRGERDVGAPTEPEWIRRRLQCLLHAR